MTACAYRSLEPVLVQRVAELRARHERDAVFVDVAHGVACRRVGRAVGGGVGVAMATAAFAFALIGFSRDPDRIASTALLFLAWPVALAAGALARLLAHPLLSVGTRVGLSGDAGVDLARLEAADPLRNACDVAMAWERRSVAWPMAAVSLLAPLTIHGIVWFGLSRPAAADSAMADFGTWIGLSAIIVGHAHLALLVCSVRWARKLRAVETLELRIGLGRAWGKALLVTLGVACLPGLVLLAVPPILVATTGLVFVPLMFHLAARTVARERMALEAT